MASAIHLNPIRFNNLPSHPLLENPTTATTRLPHHEFLHSILKESQSFLNETLPANFQEDPKPRKSHPASSPVYLSTCQLPSEGGEGKEYWVCRRSMHTDEAVQGSASFAEFRDGLRVDHSRKEMEYTPSVSSVSTVLEWPAVESVEGGWREVDMHVNVITHTFHPGALISPRTFINLIISADLPSTNPTSSSPGFVTIQIPLTVKPTGSTPKALEEKIIQSAPKNTIFASYASVERARLLSASSSQEVEWTMATTSDAGGAIPQWVQRSWTMGGVPKAVVADVGLFIGWVGKTRKG